MRSIDGDLRGEFTRIDEILLSAGGDRASIKSRIIAFLFSGIFFMAGVVTLYASTLYPLVKYLGSGDWEKTVATVTELGGRFRPCGHTLQIPDQRNRPHRGSLRMDQ